MNEKTARKTREWLMQIGVRPSLGGFNMIVDAVGILLDNPSAQMGKGVYAPIGEKHGVRASGVERRIRFAIESAFLDGNIEALEKMFTGLISRKKGKVDNATFLHTIALKLKDSEANDVA